METEISIIREDHLNSVLQLQEEASRELGHERFHSQPNKIVTLALAQGRSVGCFHQGSMVGMRLSYSSIIPPEFLCRLPIVDPDSIGALFFSVYVSPPYRGFGLSKKMTTLVLEMLRLDGIKHCYATVHPANYPNIMSLKSTGFNIVYKGHFHNGKPRLLLYRESA